MMSRYRNKVRLTLIQEIFIYVDADSPEQAREMASRLEGDIKKTDPEELEHIEVIGCDETLSNKGAL